MSEFFTDRGTKVGATLAIAITTISCPPEIKRVEGVRSVSQCSNVNDWVRSVGRPAIWIRPWIGTDAHERRISVRINTRSLTPSRDLTEREVYAGLVVIN